MCLVIFSNNMFYAAFHKNLKRDDIKYYRMTEPYIKLLLKMSGDVDNDDDDNVFTMASRWRKVFIFDKVWP